jgi:hypothetical protein
MEDFILFLAGVMLMSDLTMIPMALDVMKR